jgi:hypothetical protein
MIQALAAGAGVVGSIFGGIGASQRASDIKKAVKRNTRDVKKFTKDQLEKSDELSEQKQKYLEEGDPFADMGRFIFGDPSAATYSNLRKSQSDFAKLAAGDTTGFQKEVSSIVSNSLASTFGGPRGSFENLSAKNLLNFRQLGANTAMSLTDYFGRSGQQLFGNKFGILDQTFDRQAKLNEYQTNAINQMRLEKAGQSGVGMSALGNTFQAIGSGLSTYGAYTAGEAALKQNQTNMDKYFSILGAGSKVANAVMPSASFNQPPLPFNSPMPTSMAAYGGGGGYLSPTSLMDGFIGLGGFAPRSFGTPFSSMVGSTFMTNASFANSPIAQYANPAAAGGFDYTLVPP